MRKYLCAFLVFGVSACGPGGDFFDDFSDVFHDAGAVQGAGMYRISDSGVRCVQAPCPTLLVSPLDSRQGVLVSGLEFPAHLPEEKREQASQRIHTSNGLVVQGAPRGEGHARVFVIHSLIER